MRDLPKRLEELLKNKQGLYSAVLSSVYALHDWLYDNKTPFFPEYTDHSLKHLSEVLFSADRIISDHSWEQITPEDAAALVISVLLHDCAMHLSEDGFYQLINNDLENVNSSYIKDSTSWKSLWLDFMAEAKRFDGKKLFKLFGNDQPVKDIPENKINMTTRDKLLIGEFLRRHHARLAHEISLSGVPGSGEDRLKLTGFEEKYLDLFGFIARSHNMGLREAVDYLEPPKRRLHYNVHVPYVMLLLRISDYIQIHSERAPNNLLKIKKLLSPISHDEWNKHHAIEDINNASEDPEAIYIEANPQCAYDFESLKYLFSDIQRELDKSWAVLGEVYGRYEGSNLLGIKVRRIRSNLDNVENFIKSKQPNYIPKLLKIKTADTEMMELLIAPLYGEDPGVGIRELIQNAVDACVELKDLEVQGLLQERKSKLNGVIVKVYKNTEGGKLVIEDYGIGMNIEIVEKYFLNIGASFRNSDLWKKNHEKNGKSNVFRTGRFGIGFLAAYLLGDNIKVTTRRVNENENSGLTFQCKKGEPIEVANCCFRYGTKIEIELDEKVVNALLKNERSWDWYCLPEPEVKRFIIKGEEQVLLEQNVSFPDKDGFLKSDIWHDIEVNGFERVLWSYTKIKDRSNSRYYYDYEQFGLVCNGIFVNTSWGSIDSVSRYSSLDLSSDSGFFDANIPTLVVFDQDGKLPLNLQRTGLSGENPFIEKLKESVSCELVKSIIDKIEEIDKTSSKEVIEKILSSSMEEISSSVSYSIRYMGDLIVCKEGLLPMDFNLVKESGIKNLFVEATNPEGGLWSCQEFLKYEFPYLPVDASVKTKSKKADYLRALLDPSRPFEKSGIFDKNSLVGRKILIKKKDADEVFKVGQIPRYIWSSFVIEWENEKWALYSSGDDQKLAICLDSVSKCLDNVGSFGFVFYSFDWSNEASQKNESPFCKAWRNILGKIYL